MISTKKGFGETLHLGSRGAGEKTGGRAAEIYTRTDPYDPRYCTVNTLIFPFESREPIQQLHEAGLVLSQWSSWAKGVEEAHMSSDVVRGIAEAFWGSADAADMTTLKGKALAARKIQDRQIAKECAGFCDWIFPLTDIPAGDNHVGDPSIEAGILSAVFNEEITEKDFYTYGERTFNLQRAIYLREGHKAGTDDYLPEEWHNKPIETHVADPECIVPGKGGKIVSQIGRRVERTMFESIRDEFYEYRRWDVRTGLQSAELLKALHLDDIIDDLRERGLVVERAGKRSLGLKLARAVYFTLKSPGTDLPSKGSDHKKDIITGNSLTSDEIMTILSADAEKYIDKKIAHNFEGWTKKMQYYFTDTDQYYCIEFVDGRTRPPVRLNEPVKNPEISYEMDSRVIKAMSEGRVSGEQAYLKRLLRLKASFTDMMKLQSLNKF